jgi:predicted O-methyltransferase YrrM
MTLPQLAPGQCLMQRDEIEALYALVVACAPYCALEIGSYKGGSALVIGEALRAGGQGGRLFMVDPLDQRDPALWAPIAERAIFVQEPSPGGIATAVGLAGQPFDFAFVDGLHDAAHVRADIEGLIPVLRAGASVVFHDAHHAGVRQAIDEAVAMYGWTDRGLIAGCCLQSTTGAWGGLRQVVTP